MSPFRKRRERVAGTEEKETRGIDPDTRER